MLHLLLAALLTSYNAPSSPFSRHDVAIAGDAQHALVAWTQIDNGNMRIHISPLGSFRDIAMPLAGQLQMSPAIAFDGVNYLVVWAEVDFRTTTAYAVRVSGSGELLDAAPIRVGNFTNGLLPRAGWSNGQYRATAGTVVTGINGAGVRTILPMPSAIDFAVDVALPDDTTVFVRVLPGGCSFFPIVRCVQAQNLLIFQPGDTISLQGKPVWIEAADHAVVWNDGAFLNITRDGITQSLLTQATNATVAGSLVVYEKNERLYSFDVDTKKETVLTEPGTVAPALLNRGNGRYTLLYRTTSQPVQLRTMDIGAPEPPVRRRTF